MAPTQSTGRATALPPVVSGFDTYSRALAEGAGRGPTVSIDARPSLTGATRFPPTTATSPPRHRAQESRTNFNGSNFSQAIFVGANLCSADLRGANLSYANLQRGKLDGADFTGANLRLACLFDVSLKNVIGLTSEQIEDALTNDLTILPDYLKK